MRSLSSLLAAMNTWSLSRARRRQLRQRHARSRCHAPAFLEVPLALPACTFSFRKNCNGLDAQLRPEHGQLYAVGAGDSLSRLETASAVNLTPIPKISLPSVTKGVDPMRMKQRTVTAIIAVFTALPLLAGGAL